MFVDIEFDRDDLSDTDSHPTTRHLSVLKDHGGQVVYQFQFPAVRAWVPTANVPALAEDDAVVGVFWVDNLRRYDWNAGVGYISPYSYKTGKLRYEELGGRVDFEFDQINAISGLIPDRSVAILRRDRNVHHVESRVPFPNPDCR
jgi:hypothetical protein